MGEYIFTISIGAIMALLGIIQVYRLKLELKSWDKDQSEQRTE